MRPNSVAQTTRVSSSRPQPVSKSVMSAPQWADPPARRVWNVLFFRWLWASQRPAPPLLPVEDLDETRPAAPTSRAHGQTMLAEFLRGGVIETIEMPAWLDFRYRIAITSGIADCMRKASSR